MKKVFSGLMKFMSYKYMWIVFVGLYFLLLMASLFDKQISKELNKMYGGGGDGLVDMLFLLFYLLGFLISFFISLSFLNKKVNYKHRIFHLLVLGFLLYWYFYFLEYCRYPLCMFHWSFFLPPFITFCFAIRGTKLITLYLCLFFAFPIYVVVRDKILVKKFHETCEARTPKPIYNPIYLPDEYFHEEDVDGEKKMVPNVVEIKTYKEDQNVNNTIYIYINCDWFNKKEEYSIVGKSNRIVLCRDYDYEDGAVTIEYVKEYGDLKILSRTYALKGYTGIRYITGFSVPGSNLYCVYNKDEKVDIDKNIFPTRKKSEQLPSNYIKPLSEKTTELGE